MWLVRLLRLVYKASLVALVLAGCFALKGYCGFSSEAIAAVVI